MDAIHGKYANEFLSTPSARRATNNVGVSGGHIAISIHALREEGDSSVIAPISKSCLFLSTPSARRATFQCRSLIAGHEISIHALREEGDTIATKIGKLAKNFYPRPPRGGRPPTSMRSLLSSRNFYPRPPRGGRLL